MVTVELQSVDGGAYTATLTMSALEPASKLLIGDNAIARNTDYSFIADRDGTLYTTIKELWCDGTYCSEASLSSTAVFKINGVVVYGFENSYEVKTGDEITVTLGSQFGESASAVLNLSWDGFYKHPLGSRGNPIVLDYSQFPTTVEIGAGEEPWYKLTGFYSGYYMDIHGENAYVIISDQRYDVPADGLRIPAVTNLQIGNAGTSSATFTLEAGIQEGTSGNPKDLVTGEQTTELDKSENYYYDFVAPQEGSASFTVSGDNWRFFYSLIDIDGTVLVSEEDHRAVRGDADTVTVDLATGQSILIKLGTMDSGWTAPGGELTVRFSFTPSDGACTHTNTEIRNAVDATCSAEGYTGDTYCLDCGVRTEQGETIPMIPHTPGPEATCTAPQICTVCSAELAPAKGHHYEDGVCTDCGEEEPVVDPALELTLGENSLSSGNVYNYVVTEEGRLEFDFVVRDSDGKQVYQYAYGQGKRVRILVNGKHIANLVDTKVSVNVGDVVTVELQSVDGGAYTATLTLTALEPAAKMVLGDNNISKDTDYSFIATRDGTLYTTIKELIWENTYCTEASLSSSVVFKINGVTIYGFENAYEVKAGDEIAVRLGTSIKTDTARMVLNLSYDGFYKHPLGSRGNPYVITYAEMPTTTAKIPAGTSYWFKFTGFPAGAEIHMNGADGAYVIYGSQTIQVPAGKSINFNSVRSIQIGNSGTEEASFELYCTILEGYPENPKDLVEGENTVTIGKSDNYYYDFVAETDGTATFTVSGENWRFFYSLLAADGSYIVQDEDHQAKRGDAATVTVDMTAGQSIVLKLGTLDSSWTAPGGELTVDFHFEADEPFVPEHPLVLGKNDLSSGIEYSYVVPADGRMEFAVGSVYNSAGSKQYSWYNGSKLQILIDGKAMTASSAKRNVKAGQVITVMIESLDGDTYTADMTLRELTPAETLVLGENALTQDLEYVYTAERDGTMYISVVEMLYNGEAVNESALGNSVQMTVNGSSVSSFNKSLELKTGDEVAIVIKDYSWDGSGQVSATVNLSWESFYEHPVGSLYNPVKLMLADLPTESVELAAGSAAWYELESYYDESAWATVYPFDGKYLIVTGENAFVDVEGTVYNAVDGVVKVLMDDETLIRIGNAGSSSAVFGISVEIPEGSKDNPQDLIEGENKVTLPSYGSHYYDFVAAEDGTVTVTVSGENWKYTFAHFDANGEKLSTKDCYAKNGDTDTVEQELKAGEYIVVTVGTSQGYSQPGGTITVNFHFEPAAAHCEHANTTTTVENEVEATCTTDGSYDTVVTCDDCGTELSRVRTVVPALGHDYHDGVCGNCGEPDPNAPDNTVVVEVTQDVDVTNGVINITWDPAKLTLTDIAIHADYRSLLRDEGSVTFGYVSLSGIASGKSIATLTFEAVDPADAVVTILHRQVNNEHAACTEHTWSDWSENVLAQMERHCLRCGEKQVNPFVDVPVDAYYLEPVLWALENGVTSGTSDFTFSPSKSCIRAQAVTLLWGAAGSPEPVTTSNPFVDVTENDYFYKAVLWAVENGITSGVDTNHFGPTMNCTRGQIIVFLWRAKGSPAAVESCPFTDVQPGTVYADAIAWAAENGIASGMTSTTFGTNAVCNRAQIVTFLHHVYA